MAIFRAEIPDELKRNLAILKAQEGWRTWAHTLAALYNWYAQTKNKQS